VPFKRNMGPKERGLRVVFALALFVVGSTMIHNRIARGVFYALGVGAMLAAITGYGPLYRYIRRLRGDNRDDL